MLPLSGGKRLNRGDSEFHHPRAVSGWDVGWRVKREWRYYFWEKCGRTNTEK
jgi:hypothetical protein